MQYRRYVETPILKTLTRGAGRRPPVSIGHGSQFSKRCSFKPILTPILKTLMRGAGRHLNGGSAERVEHGSSSQRSVETQILETLTRGVGRHLNGRCWRYASTSARAERVGHYGTHPIGHSLGQSAVENVSGRGRNVTCGAPRTHPGQTGFDQAGARAGARRRTGGASRSAAAAEEEQQFQEELERRAARAAAVQAPRDAR